jgi:hypothetical protein
MQDARCKMREERRVLVSDDRTSYLGGADIRVVERRRVNEGRDKGYRGPALISRMRLMCLGLWRQLVW